MVRLSLRLLTSLTRFTFFWWIFHLFFRSMVVHQFRKSTRRLHSHSNQFELYIISIYDFMCAVNMENSWKLICIQTTPQSIRPSCKTVAQFKLVLDPRKKPIITFCASFKHSYLHHFIIFLWIQYLFDESFRWVFIDARVFDWTPFAFHWNWVNMKIVRHVKRMTADVNFQFKCLRVHQNKIKWKKNSEENERRKLCRFRSKEN